MLGKIQTRLCVLGRDDEIKNDTAKANKKVQFVRVIKVIQIVLSLGETSMNVCSLHI